MPLHSLIQGIWVVVRLKTSHHECKRKRWERLDPGEISASSLPPLLLIFPNHLLAFTARYGERYWAEHSWAGQRCVIIALSTQLSTPQNTRSEWQQSQMPLLSWNTHVPTSENWKFCYSYLTLLQPNLQTIRTAASLSSSSSFASSTCRACAVLTVPSMQRAIAEAQAANNFLYSNCSWSNTFAKPGGVNLSQPGEKSETPICQLVILYASCPHQACLHCWKLVKADGSFSLALSKLKIFLNTFKTFFFFNTLDLGAEKNWATFFSRWMGISKSKHCTFILNPETAVRRLGQRSPRGQVCDEQS